MLTFAIDTALQSCSGAILRNDVVLARKASRLEKGHAEHVAPMVAALFAEAGISPKELDRVGVVVGPGGFTGLRVGLALARSLVLGTCTKCVGVTSLEALAATTKSSMNIAPVIDARRGQVYSAVYASNGETLTPPFVSDPKEALRIIADAVGDAPCQLTGSGAALLPGPPRQWQFDGGDGQIDPVVLARLATRMPVPDQPPAPLYLRAPDAAKAKPSPFDGLSLI